MTSTQNEEFHQFACMGMVETVESLVRQNLISREKADQFLKTHTVVLLTKRTTWGKVRDFLFGADEKEAGKETITCHVVPLYLEENSDE